MAPLTPTSVFRSGSGMGLTVIGLGTWQSTKGEVETAVNAALEAGYRLIDTAYLYDNEDVIGEVLKKWFSSGKLKREDVFITTKLPLHGNSPNSVEEYLKTSLKSLQLDYVDLYLIHNPVGLKVEGPLRSADGSPNWANMKVDVTTDHVAIWKEMEKQVDAGLTKNIGLSNFNIKQMERVLKNARIPPANLQIELYLYNQCKEIQEFCKSKGMTITSYGTLGSPGAPEFVVGFNINPLEDAVVLRIAKAHDKSPAQVLLRHLLQLGIAVIPKSIKPNRIQENFQVFDFQLSQNEMKELNSLDKGEEGRRFKIKMFMDHPEYPYPK